MSVQVTFVEDVHEIGRSLNHEGGEIFDVDSSVFVFQLQLLLSIFEKEVLNFFVINL